MNRNIEHVHESEEGGHGWLWMLACCIPMIAVAGDGVEARRSTYSGL